MTKERRAIQGPVKAGILRKIKALLDKNRLGELLVLKGLITDEDLKSALAVQREARTPLGRILVDNNLISQRQLSFVLVRQTALRASTALILAMLSLTDTSGKKAYADGLRDFSIQVAFAAASSPGYTQLNNFPKLFDSTEKRSGNLKPFTKWTGVFDKFDRQVANGQAARVAAEWRQSLSGLENASLKTIAGRVNSVMNSKPYIEDKNNYGSSDYWATPVDFMQKGGDCEDYAIAKYTAMRSLGVPDERMRIAIVQDTLKNIPHAVLVVYTEDGPYILDNQIKTMLDASHAGRYKPIFSINKTAWWLHTPSSGTQVASR
ncbi:MAG: transglutaminase-like cysteine peptidase [Alphaproteobacteria bacterium]